VEQLRERYVQPFGRFDYAKLCTAHGLRRHSISLKIN